jgi:hypothetical protein
MAAMAKAFDAMGLRKIEGLGDGVGL